MVALRDGGALEDLRAELDELAGLRARVLENQLANPHLSPRPEVLEAIDRHLPRLERNVAEEEGTVGEQQRQFALEHFTPEQREAYDALERIGAEQVCGCDEWPECSHMLAAYERWIGVRPQPRAVPAAGKDPAA